MAYNSFSTGNPDGISFYQEAQTGGLPVCFRIVNAQTLTRTASTEGQLVDWDLTAVSQWATGALTTQRMFQIRGGGISFVGVSTVSYASTFSIVGGPNARTNATITNSSAVWHDSWQSNSATSHMMVLGTPGIEASVGNVTERSALRLNGWATTTFGDQTANITNIYGLQVGTYTINTTALTRTITGNMAQIYVEGVPTLGGGMSFAGTSYAMLIDAGPVRFDDHLQWGAGIAVTAGNYSVGRDADGTNQLHFNVPTGASFEFSVNDTAEVVLSATALAPGADDGNALGVSGVAWSDLFLASGAVINFAAGDYTATHAAGALTLASAATSGGAVALTITPGAHTAVTAAKSDFVVSSHTITITGGFTSENFSSFAQPTISAGSALTVTNAATVAIVAPTVASSAVITNTNALSIGSGVTGVTISNVASSTFSQLNTSVQTITLSTTTQVTSACFATAGRFSVITINQSGGAVTVDNAATIYVAGPPAAGASVTLTNTYGLFVDVGAVRFDDHLQWGAGTAVTAGNYSVGRDADGTNQLHFNIPTGASFEWSVNDVAELVLSATTLALQANTITGIGATISGTAGTAMTLKQPNQTGTNAGDILTISGSDGGSTGAGGAGGDLIIRGGDGLGTGPSAGGDVILRMGANVGATSAGVVDFQTSGTTSIGSVAAINGTNFGIRTTDNTTDFMFGFQDGATYRSAFIIDQVATQANYLQVVGAIATASPTMSALGTDTNIDLTLTPKGTGDVVVSLGGLRVSSGRIQGLQGADVASATSLTLLEGNVFEITGTTQIDQILTTGWQEGSMVTLVFNESVTVRHGIATAGANVTILLAAAANFAATANDTLTLALCSTTANGQAWREVARTAI